MITREQRRHSRRERKENIRIWFRVPRLGFVFQVPGYIGIGVKNMNAMLRDLCSNKIEETLSANGLDQKKIWFRGFIRDYSGKAYPDSFT